MANLESKHEKTETYPNISECVRVFTLGTRQNYGVHSMYEHIWVIANMALTKRLT